MSAQYSSCRLGILAVLFGDGQIDLFAIPKVGQVYEDPEQSNRIVLDLSSQAEMSQLEYTKMRPQVSLPAEEAPSLGSCLEWLPSPPHDLILVSLALPESRAIGIALRFILWEGRPIKTYSMSWSGQHQQWQLAMQNHGYISKGLHVKQYTEFDSCRILSRPFMHSWSFSISMKADALCCRYLSSCLFLLTVLLPSKPSRHRECATRIAKQMVHTDDVCDLSANLSLYVGGMLDWICLHCEDSTRWAWQPETRSVDPNLGRFKCNSQCVLGPCRDCWECEWHVAEAPLYHSRTLSQYQNVGHQVS